MRKVRIIIKKSISILAVLLFVLSLTASCFSPYHNQEQADIGNGQSSENTDSVGNTKIVGNTESTTSPLPSSSLDVQIPGYTEKVGTQTSINGLTLEEHIITAAYKNKERLDGQSLIDASIKFPQIFSGLKDESIQDKVNAQIKLMAFYAVCYDTPDNILKLFDDVVNGRSKEIEIWGTNNEYEVINVTDKSISLGYKGMISGAASVTVFHDYITISLANGEIIPFTNYFSKDSVIKAIKAHKFTWLEGQYFPGGYKGNEPELIQEFVDGVNQLTGNVVNGNPYYSNLTIYNFAIDDRFAYINFAMSDSLDGYIILKFKLDDLK